MKKGVLFAVLILLADFFLKLFVHTQSPDIAVFSCGGIDFSIVHATNTGAAWGAFSSLSTYLLIFRIGVIGALAVYLLFFKPRHPFAFLLILAGATGNVIDTFLYGHVIDMFYFKFWSYSYPVFNIADASIFLGVLILLFTKKNAPQRV